MHLINREMRVCAVGGLRAARLALPLAPALEVALVLALEVALVLALEVALVAPLPVLVDQLVLVVLLNQPV